MKLSELYGRFAPTGLDESGLAEPCSSLAEPPISAQEIAEARQRGDHEAVCRWHKGHISHSPTPSDTEGRVFWCPIGRQWWRYTKQTSGLYAPLRYRGGL